MHAPIKSRTIKTVQNSPWFDSEYVNLRRLRRKAEEYQKTGLIVHKEIFVKFRKQTTDLAYKKKWKYYGEKLKNANNKTMYVTINQLLYKKQDVVLPKAKSDIELANLFPKYFTEKINKIRSTFQTSPELPADNKCKVNNKLSTFDYTTEDEIKQIVSTHGLKCSPEDPVPVDLIKDHLIVFVPLWTKLVNLSPSESSIDCLKNAVVLPLIKHLDDLMDKDSLNNYRPVSNLLLVGKLIERVVSTRLNKHMSNNNLHSDCQYGYKKGQSTETLLLKVVNDLLVSCDNQMPSILMLLDLSAAFDMVDQKKLLCILQYEIGIEGTALKWFTSFLINRTQRVKIGNSYSEEVHMLYGFAQGSVLGPNLFNIYISDHCGSTLNHQDSRYLVLLTIISCLKHFS